MQAKDVHSPEKILDVLKEVNWHVSLLVWREISEERSKDKLFDPSSKENIHKINRSIGVYQKKNEFLAAKGYKPEWGCPSEVKYYQLRYF